jgi:hypothetical protein
MDTNKSQSETMEIRLPDEKGVSQPAANINYSIRPNRGMNINLEIFNAELVATDVESVKKAVNSFLAEATTKAFELGLPIGK